MTKYLLPCVLNAVISGKWPDHDDQAKLRRWAGPAEYSLPLDDLPRLIIERERANRKSAT